MKFCLVLDVVGLEYIIVYFSGKEVGRSSFSIIM